MSVLFFDGFDLHTRSLEAVVGPIGFNDAQGTPNWTGGASSPLNFVDGYQGGGAAGVTSWLPVHTDHAGSQTAMRVSWMCKYSDKIGTPGTSYGQFLAIGHTSSVEYVGLVVTSESAEGVNMRLATFSGSSDFGGTVIGDADVSFDEDWAHYELYVDTVSDRIEIWKNGTLVDSVDNGLVSANTVFRVRMKAPGWSNGHVHRLYLDHVIVTDGESLRDDVGIHGVAVTYCEGAKGTTSGLRTRGRIYVNGTDYFADTHLSNFRGANGDNYSPEYMNVHNDYWILNPDTGAAWGANLDLLTAWGLCRTDDTGGTAIFCNAALSYIEVEEDEPLVLFSQPDTNIILDGPWVRTDESAAWHLHVDNYPRTFPVANDGFERDDPFGANADEFLEDYIGVQGPGCLTFTFIEPDEEPELGLVGFTFAEEYQTSYRDWESIDGVGDDFCSYFISGYKIHGEGNKKFQSNYVTVNFETAATGSAYIQGIWDYALGNEPNEADSRSDTGRWGSTQQIYGPTNSVSYKHAFSKLKIRGHGKAMQLKVKCESGKPFYINGWAMFVSGNSTT